MGTLRGGDLPVVAIFAQAGGTPCRLLRKYSLGNSNQRTQVETGTVGSRVVGAGLSCGYVNMAAFPRVYRLVQLTYSDLLTSFSS